MTPPPYLDPEHEEDEDEDDSSQGEEQEDRVAIKEHALYCFDVVHAQLHHLPVPKPPRAMIETSDGGGGGVDDEYPLFVTWNLASRSAPHSYRLRGCIGNFEPHHLVEGLRDYAAISAFKDHRFDPITIKELPRLQCSVSLLTDFELCDSYTDWSIERHGIYVQIPNPALGSTPPYTAPSLVSSLPASEVNSTTSLATTMTPTSSTDDPTADHEPPPPKRERYRSISRLPKFDPWSSASQSHFRPGLQSMTGRPMNPHKLPWILTATYLPDVALEQGWTHVEALDSAIRKAGYSPHRSSKISEEIRQSARVTRYQSKKVTVTYDEWRAWIESAPARELSHV